MTRGLATALLAVLAAACAGAPRGIELEARVDAAVAAHMAEHGAPGVAVVIREDGAERLAKGYGLARASGDLAMTADTIVPLASISKQFAAALLIQMEQDGLVGLDDSAAQHLPDLFYDEPRITLRRLLRQTSGLPDFFDLEGSEALENATEATAPMRAFLELADAAPRGFAPGERWSYSNTNYTVAALIAETAGGAPFADLQRDRLLAPAGLDQALGECPDFDAHLLRAVTYAADGGVAPLLANPAADHGAGGVCGSARALAAWTEALARGGVVGVDGYAAMIETAPVAAGYSPPYGLGLSTLPFLGRPAVWHAGSLDGASTLALRLPDDGLTVVVLINHGEPFVAELAADIVRAALGLPEPAPLGRAILDVTLKNRLEGRYDDTLFAYDVEVEKDRLKVTIDGFMPEPVDFWHQDDGRFVAPLAPDTLAITIPNGDAPVSRFWFDWMELRSFPERVD